MGAREQAPVASNVDRFQSKRYQSLDIWRGVACLSVAAGHASSYMAQMSDSVDAGWPERIVRAVLAYCWAGVPIFFVISGYCIAASAQASAGRGDRSVSFFRKRFRRIFPPYWACVAGTILIVVAAERIVPGIYTQTPPAITFPTAISPIHWVGNLTLTETWLGHVHGTPFEWKNMFLGHAWTLCYEEQFYVVVGLVLLAAGARLYATLVLITFAVCLRWYFGSPNVNSGFFFDGRWLLFAAGFAVYFDQKRRDWWTWIAVRSFLLLGLVWAVRDPRVFAQRSSGVEHEWLVAFLFAWTILFLHRWDRQIVSFRLLRPLEICGLMCYSIYLVHWTVVKPIATSLYLAKGGSFLFTLFVTIPICLAATVSVGWIFHRFVEKRFMSGAVGDAGGHTSAPATPESQSACKACSTV